jgi:hypothetical protein
MRPVCDNIVVEYTEQTGSAYNSSNAVFFSGHVKSYPIPGYATGDQFVQSAFGQPFARHIPYPRFDDLQYIIDELYIGDDAVFRYKQSLYTFDGDDFIKIPPNDIHNYWNENDKNRALAVTERIKQMIRYSTCNRNLRWVLLDIYYEIATVEMMAARAKVMEAIKTAHGIGIVPVPGEFLINHEIDHLTEAVALYKGALQDYFSLFNDPMGIDVASLDCDRPEAIDVSFGYHLFKQEVPGRSLQTPLFKDMQDGWEFDQYNQVPAFEGYKDLILLFDIFSEYARATADLAKLHILRSSPASGYMSSDLDQAAKLIHDFQLSSYIDVQILLNMLPEYTNGNNETTSRLIASISRWEHEFTGLVAIQSYLDGETNLLGFSDDFLVFAQSVVPGDPQTAYFDTFHYLKDYLDDPTGPLYTALNDLEKAKRDYANYRDRSDQLYTQFHNMNEAYDERLREIVGVNPGEPGYATPFENVGSELFQQMTNIELAKKRIESNTREITNLDQQIRIEIWRRGKEQKINDAIHQVYLDYGEKQTSLTEELTRINAEQAYYNNIAAKKASVSESKCNTNMIATQGEVVLYEHKYYKGKELRLTKDDSCINNLANCGFNDKVSSYRIGPDTEVIFFEHAGKEGSRFMDRSNCFGLEVSNIKNSKGEDWNDIISSLKILERLDSGTNKSISGGLESYAENAVYQKEKEETKGRLQTEKERFAAKERAHVQTLHDSLLDISSKALIKTWLLRMDTLLIASAEAGLVLTQERGRLTALINEKEDLERRKENFNTELADRYFADPTHRLLKETSITRAELSFDEAQKWLFLALRALEYRWNLEFNHKYAGVAYIADTLLTLRNADELVAMFSAMKDFDSKVALGQRNDNGYKKFSYRQDFLGYRNGGTYFDPLSREPIRVEPWEAFRNYLKQESLYLTVDDPENPFPWNTTLCLDFSTAFEPESGGFFTWNRWLEKIKYLKIKIHGGVMGGSDSTLDAQLVYGGTSFIRNMHPGKADPDRPDIVKGEMTAYT